MASKRPHLQSTYVIYLLTTMAALPFRGALSESTLLEDYKEFCKIVPFDKIVDIIHKYNETDPEVREFLMCLEDPDIQEYAHWLYEQPPLHKALAFLERHGVPGYALVDHLMAAFGWPPLQPLTHDPDHHQHEHQHQHDHQHQHEHEHQHRRREPRSVHSMAQEMRALVPPLQLFRFYSRKMKTSKEFRGLDSILRSEDFNEMVLKAMEHKGYKKFIHLLEEGGMDVDSLRRSLTTLFGWSRHEKKKHSRGLFTKLFSSLFN